MHSTTTKSQPSRGVSNVTANFSRLTLDADHFAGRGEHTAHLFSAIEQRVGRGCEVFVKNEGVNPTRSFKDRGMTVAVSKAIERGTNALICASTGNTSASAAAYARAQGFHASSFCLREKSRPGNCFRLLPMERKSSRSTAISMTHCESFANWARPAISRS